MSARDRAETQGLLNNAWATPTRPTGNDKYNRFEHVLVTQLVNQRRSNIINNSPLNGASTADLSILANRYIYIPALLGIIGSCDGISKTVATVAIGTYLAMNCAPNLYDAFNNSDSRKKALIKIHENNTTGYKQPACATWLTNVGSFVGICALLAGVGIMTASRHELNPKISLGDFEKGKYYYGMMATAVFPLMTMLIARYSTHVSHKQAAQVSDKDTELKDGSNLQFAGGLLMAGGLLAAAYMMRGSENLKEHPMVALAGFTVIQSAFLLNSYSMVRQGHDAIDQAVARKLTVLRNGRPEPLNLRDTLIKVPCLNQQVIRQDTKSFLQTATMIGSLVAVIVGGIYLLSGGDKTHRYMGGIIISALAFSINSTADSIKADNHLHDKDVKEAVPVAVAGAGAGA